MREKSSTNNKKY